MKSLVNFWDGLKFSDPKVFGIVSIIANILVNTLMYFATYGAEESRPLFFALTSIITLFLNNIGVRTTRFIQKEQEFTDQVTEFDNEVKDTLNDSNIN